MRLTDLLHIDVVDEDGVALGSLMDLRCRVHGRAGNDARVAALVFAAPGFLEHIGVRRAQSCEAAWKDVLRVTDERVVIRRNKHRRAA